MNPLSYHNKINLLKTHFSICNLSSNVFNKKETESPRDTCISTRMTTSNSFPRLKIKQFSTLGFDRTLGKKVPLKGRQAKSPPRANTSRQTSEDMITARYSKEGESSSKIKEKYAPVKVYRTSSGIMEASALLTSRRSSSVKVVSLNEQISMRKNQQAKKPVEGFEEKFTRRYDHFRKTQKNSYMKSLGTFKSLAEIHHRVNSIDIGPNPKQSIAEWETEMMRACSSEQEKAAFQKKFKQIVRLRRKILDGEIDFSQYCSDRELRKISESGTNKEGNISPTINRPALSPESVKLKDLKKAGNYWPQKRVPFRAATSLEKMSVKGEKEPTGQATAQTTRDLSEAASTQTKMKKVEEKKVENSQNVVEQTLKNQPLQLQKSINLKVPEVKNKDRPKTSDYTSVRKVMGVNDKHHRLRGIQSFGVGVVMDESKKYSSRPLSSDRAEIESNEDRLLTEVRTRNFNSVTLMSKQMPRTLNNSITETVDNQNSEKMNEQEHKRTPLGQIMMEGDVADLKIEGWSPAAELRQEQ